MKKIVSTQFVSNVDGNVFYKALNKMINYLQDDGEEVEIQYQTLSPVGFSALIIGRKDDVKWKENLRTTK